MRRVLAAGALAAITALAALAAPAFAQDIACGLPYRIAPGDTLHRIAVRAYGERGDYRTLFRANAERLRWRDASSIEAGQVIAIPCPDGAAASILAVAALAAPSGAPDPAIAVAEAAMARIGAARFDRLETGARLDSLFGADLYRLAAPIARPDCDAATDAPTRGLCEDFLWSAPLGARYVTLVGRAGEAPPAAPEETRLCRAEEPGSDVAACLDALLRGAADWARVDAAAFDARAAAPERAGRFAEHAAFLRETTLHAVAPRALPSAAGDIAAIDAALAALEVSGEAHALRAAALLASAQP